MEIVICGDSFCSASKHNQNHFSQILQDHYNHNVINLARGSASAINIAYQIKKAIELGPDLVIYSRSTRPRFDLRVSFKNFESTMGLKNFVYANPNEISTGSPFVGNKDAPIFSNNFGSLLPVPEYQEKLWLNISDGKKNAIKQYIAYLYDESLAIEVDGWIYDHWHSMVVQNNIKCLSFEDVGKEAYQFSEENPNYPEIHHTDATTQKVIAEKLQTLIKSFCCHG